MNSFVDEAAASRPVLKTALKSARRIVRFPALCTDAETLGVHRNHLYLVLAGKRVSRDLSTRYAALKGGKQ